MGRPFLRTEDEIAKAAPCHSLSDDSDIDVENIVDHIDATPDSELVYVDVFPDGSPCCVASHGLTSFSQSSLRRPLQRRGVASFDLDTSVVISAP